MNDYVRCGACQSTTENNYNRDLSRCTACRVVYYCSFDCQQYDWPNHKFNCEDPAWRPDNQDLAEARRVAVGQQQLEKYKRRHKKRKRDVEIVETTGETRQEWNLRVEKKMFVECGLFSDKAWDNYMKWVRKMRGKPILYSRPATPKEHMLRFDENNPLDISKIKKGIVQIEFAPGLGLNDTDIENLAAVDADIRSAVRVFIAGDPLHLLEKTVALEITDAGVKKLCQAYPNLEVVKLMSTRKLGPRGFPEIVLNCAKIEAILITAKEGSNASLDGDRLIDDLIDTRYRTTLRYLEFRGVHFSIERREWLGTLTKQRKNLEIVVQYESDPAFLWRAGEHTTLSEVPEQKGVEVEEVEHYSSNHDDSDDASEPEAEYYY